MLKNKSFSPSQRGLSLVELMVGIAVGMFVVAAASTLVATQLVDNRRLLLEVQVQQDLRAAADIISRDLRRIGSWGLVTAPAGGVWSAGSLAMLNPTPTDITLSGGSNTSKVEYASSRTTGSVGPYGFWLDNGVIKAQLGTGGWQVLTDEAAMKVTVFRVVVQAEPPIRIACPKRCADTTDTCWPTVTVRSLAVDISGESASDASVKRSVRTVVRVRNDQVKFNDVLEPTVACPA